MKLLTLIPLLFASCGGIPTPWPSEGDVLEAADAAALERSKEVAEAAAEGGADMSGYKPAPGYEAPEPSGTDWGTLITLAITALSGGGLAIGHRIYDHGKQARRQRRTATA